MKARVKCLSGSSGTRRGQTHAVVEVDARSEVTASRVLEQVIKCFVRVHP